MGAYQPENPALDTRIEEYRMQRSIAWALWYDGPLSRERVRESIRYTTQEVDPLLGALRLRGVIEECRGWEQPRYHLQKKYRDWVGALRLWQQFRSERKAILRERPGIERYLDSPA